MTLWIIFLITFAWVWPEVKVLFIFSYFSYSSGMSKAMNMNYILPTKFYFFFKHVAFPHVKILKFLLPPVWKNPEPFWTYIIIKRRRQARAMLFSTLLCIGIPFEVYDQYKNPNLMHCAVNISQWAMSMHYLVLIIVCSYMLVAIKLWIRQNLSLNPTLIQIDLDWTQLERCMRDVVSTMMHENQLLKNSNSS